MKNLEWETLSSEYLFSDLWFKVRKDRCESPGGKIIDPFYVYLTYIFILIIQQIASASMNIIFMLCSKLYTYKFIALLIVIYRAPIATKV